MFNMYEFEVKGNKIRFKKIGSRIYVPCRDIGDILGLVNARDSVNYFLSCKDKKTISIFNDDVNQTYKNLCISINGIKEITLKTRKGKNEDKKLILNEIVPFLEKEEKYLNDIEQLRINITEESSNTETEETENGILDKIKNLLRKVVA